MASFPHVFRVVLLTAIVLVSMFGVIILWSIQTARDATLSNVSTSKRAKVAIVQVGIGRDQEEFNIMRHYCAMHGYAFATSEKEYPVVNHIPCTWNLPTTHYAVTRRILPQFDWVMFQQFDSQLINLTIPLEGIIARVPPDAHVVVAAGHAEWFNDVAVPFRNSPTGNAFINELMDIQSRMHFCPAADMCAFLEFMLVRANNTNGVVYNHECIADCAANPGNVHGGIDDHFRFMPLLTCQRKWSTKLGVGADWDWKQVAIPGVWIQPANDGYVLEHGLPNVGEDVSSVGPAGHSMEERATHYNWDGIQDWNKWDAVYSADPGSFFRDPRFLARAPTTISIHFGRGGNHPLHTAAREWIYEFWPTVRRPVGSNYEVTTEILRDAHAHPLAINWDMSVQAFSEIL